MLTRASVGDVAGINGVDWDAVELPSQFMENWLYDEPTLYGFAKHYETGEPLPKEMFEKLKLQKTYGAGMMACRQLYFGQMDLELHSNFDAAANKEGGESIFDVQGRVAEKYSPYNMPLPEDRFLCAFSHIFAGGYAAPCRTRRSRQAEVFKYSTALAVSLCMPLEKIRRLWAPLLLPMVLA